MSFKLFEAKAPPFLIVYFCSLLPVLASWVGSSFMEGSCKAGMWNDKPVLLSERSKTCRATVPDWEPKAPQLRGRDLEHPGALILDGLNCDCWTNVATAHSEVKTQMEHELMSQ